MTAEPLRDRTIVIIGGTGGLGASATAACLEAGANVVAVGRDGVRADQLRDRLKGPLHVTVGDAADPGTSRRAVEVAIGEFGRLDGLYHVAGGSGRSFGDGPLHTIPPNAWRATLAINLESAVWSLQAALSWWLKQQTGGTLLLMSSALARHPAPHFFATHAYAAAKSAVEGLVRSTASYYAQHQIRINAVAPGLVETPMSTRACGNSEIAAYTQARQPLDGGRVGLPADLDAAAVFFLSDQSRFVTGQILAVDGGWSVSDASPPQSES